MLEANGLVKNGKICSRAIREQIYVIGREEWKTIIVSELMYGCGALAWYQCEYDCLEVIHN